MKDLSIEIVQSGEFEIRAGRPMLTRSGDQISCQLGRVFGIDYRFKFPQGAGGTIPVDFKWQHPNFDIPRLGVRGTVSSGGVSNPVAPKGQGKHEGRSLWSVTHPEELVSGRYDFQILDRTTGDVLFTKSFDLVGC